MRAFRLTILTLLAFFLAGCAGGAPYSTPIAGVGGKEFIGTLLGAAAGGLAGSQVGGGNGQLVATGIGVLAGAIAGHTIGAHLDEADRVHAAQSRYQALHAPLGTPVQWRNPRNGHSGESLPTREGYTSSGLYCREYRTTVHIEGKSETAYGQACRTHDGRWRISGA